MTGAENGRSTAAAVGAGLTWTKVGSPTMVVEGTTKRRVRMTAKYAPMILWYVLTASLDASEPLAPDEGE